LSQYFESARSSSMTHKPCSWRKNQSPQKNCCGATKEALPQRQRWTIDYIYQKERKRKEEKQWETKNAKAVQVFGQVKKNKRN